MTINEKEKSDECTCFEEGGWEICETCKVDDIAFE
jgi:hypothetical protein